MEKIQLAEVAVGAVFGFGVHSYLPGLAAMLRLLRAPEPSTEDNRQG
jgi:3-dehydroquinate dehydratase